MKPPMKHAILLCGAALALLATGCASSRKPHQAATPSPDTCTAIVAEDIIVMDSTTPVRTVPLRRAGTGRCYTTAGLRIMARELACRNGVPFAHLYNINEPNVMSALFLSGPCALADVDLFETVPVHMPSPSPVITYDTLSNSGLELFATAAVGGVAGGQQKYPPLTPRPNVNKVNLGVSLEYFRDWLGLEADVDFFSRANSAKKDYEPVALYHVSIFRLGLGATLWDKVTLAGRMKLDVSAGGNYTLLRLHDELSDINGGLRTDMAQGAGAYGKVKFKTFTTWGLGILAGAKYEYEKPEFDGGFRMDAHTIQMLFGLGYKF